LRKTIATIALIAAFAAAGTVPAAQADRHARHRAHDLTVAAAGPGSSRPSALHGMADHGNCYSRFGRTFCE
jgi:hypothetical protein